MEDEVVRAIEKPSVYTNVNSFKRPSITFQDEDPYSSQVDQLDGCVGYLTCAGFPDPDSIGR